MTFVLKNPVLRNEEVEHFTDEIPYQNGHQKFQGRTECKVQKNAKRQGSSPSSMRCRGSLNLGSVGI